MISLFKKEELYPWAGKPSIYASIQEQLDRHGRIVDDKLPDDEAYWADQPFRWVAGGLDGAFGRHAGGERQEASVHELAKLLAKLSRKPGMRTRRAVYVKLMEEDILGMIDPLLDALRGFPGIRLEQLYQEATWLAEHGAHRNVVKFGIALLGRFETELHRDLILTLGKHEEFTLYASVAVQNSLANVNQELFELAQFVHGWGKIQLVERLEPATPEIKAWLLRHGCRNSIMNEYLAYACAVNGELHLALAGDAVDEALYEGAGEILSALLRGGPAEDIDDYAHAPEVLGHFLRLSRDRGASVAHLADMMEIYEFLNAGDDERWAARYAGAWTEAERIRLLELSKPLVFRADWPDKVWAALVSGSRAEQYTAIRAARALGLDVWPELYRQLQAAPADQSLYYELMRTDDRSRVEELVRFAERALPLADIAVGPADQMGLGPEFAVHGALDSIVQDLDAHPGVGKTLIASALQSPVIRNRSMALKALEAWPLDAWDDSVIAGMKSLAKVEPDDRLRDRIREILQERGLL
ncbi:limonene hydroxylase [Paenibacillus rhizovicinus]|uniref:Limonene hydroxylase n=1 Tax=Paenibacillus rhizovicinus TaxID=2704463 RepID=A0A6C0P0D3_9BACL|nr:limonene hydroxylase [Paenibacillus rhizovicinus]QHW31841.1 limonene hydroxylase [Paenibacillus rhizovicinus]